MAVKVTVLNPEILKQVHNKPLQAGLSAALEKAKEAVELKFSSNPGSWVPLAPMTLLDRRRKGFGAGPMLYRTGHLKGQAVQQTTIEGNSGTISTSDPMALLQNNGGGNIPARPFYTLTDQDKAAIMQAFKSGVTGSK